MNKQLSKKILCLVCVFILSLFMFLPYSEANEGDNIWSQGSQFIESGSKKAPIATDKMQEKLMPIGRILVTVATITLTIVTIVMGIKYMMCDNANERAKLKTQLIGLVISTVVIYGAQFIWSTLYAFMSNVTK